MPHGLVENYMIFCLNTVLSFDNIDAFISNLLPKEL